MLPHRIRLRGPWRLLPLDGGAERTIRLPVSNDNAVATDIAGHVLWLRTFERPRRGAVWADFGTIAARYVGLADPRRTSPRQRRLAFRRGPADRKLES